MFIYYLLITTLLVNVCFTKHRNYEDFDVRSLLSNATRSKSLIECVTDESKCLNKEDKEMKHDAIEMLRTSCSSCTEGEKQKYMEAMQAVRRSMDQSQVVNMIINKITDMLQIRLDSDS